MNQREIKFRAWVENKDLFGEEAKKKWPNGFMFTGFSFKNVFAGQDEANTWCKNEIWEEPDWDKAILMQYTGLKDKNGKEIYEGDFLVSEFLHLHEYNDIKKTPCAVEWHERLASFVLSKTNQNMVLLSDYLVWWKSSAFEVIGNIYENPELLTKPL